MATSQIHKLFMSNNGVHGTLIEEEELDSHFKDMTETLFAPGCEINMKERIIHQLMKQGDDGTTCLVVFEVHGTIENGRQPRGINLVQECQFPFELFHLEMTAPGCSVLAQPGLSATVTRFLGEIPGGGVLSRDATDLSLMKDGLYFFVTHHPANVKSKKLNVTFETELSLTAKLNLINIYILGPDDGTLKCITISPPPTKERDNQEYGNFTVGKDGTLSYIKGTEWSEPRERRKAAQRSGFTQPGARSHCDTSYTDVSYFIQQAQSVRAFNGLFIKLQRVLMLRGNCSPSYADFPAYKRKKQPITRKYSKDVTEYLIHMKEVSNIFFNGFKFALMVSYMVSKIRKTQKVPMRAVGDAAAASAHPDGSAQGPSCSLARIPSVGWQQTDAGDEGGEDDEEEILNRLVIQILMNSKLRDSKDVIISNLKPLPSKEDVKKVSSLFVEVKGVDFDVIFQELLTRQLNFLAHDMTKFDLVSASDIDRIQHIPTYNDIFERIQIEPPLVDSVSSTQMDRGSSPPPPRKRARLAPTSLKGGARKTRKRRRKRRTKRKRKTKRKTKKRQRRRR